VLEETVNNPKPSSSAIIPLSLLRLFTPHPIRTKNDLFPPSFATRNLTTCFTSNLHLSLNIAQSRVTSYQADQHQQPQESPPPPANAASTTSFTASTTTSPTTSVVQHYHEFRDFLWAGLGLPLPPATTTTATTTTPRQILVVKRLASRKITNHGKLVTALERRYNDKSQWVVHESIMEGLSFMTNLQLLQSTTILITQYSSAAHNMIFLRPGSVLVLLMQPGWCDWHSDLTNQVGS